MPKRKQVNSGRPRLSTEFFLEAEANVEGQQCAVAQGGPRSGISDDEAEVTHLLNTAEPETEVGGVLQAYRGVDPPLRPLRPFQPTPARQAVSILRRVDKGLACFDDMTLDGLRGLIAFLRGGIMSDRDERTGDGSRESRSRQYPSLIPVTSERDQDERIDDGSGESRDGQDPPTVVEERELWRFVKLEKPLLRAAVKLAFKKDPHEMQLIVIRRLVFGSDDTILIAKTGFGKSLTFQAFTVLTGCWTIQLVPLNRLGGQHYDDAARLPDVSPCLVTAETKHLNRGLFAEICRQKYNYVLLGPEQAVSGGFRVALRDPNVQQCIGLVAIDELHVLHDWDFRASYPQLRELRVMLTESVRVYGCTATLTEETEKAVLRLGGFRNRKSGALSIIRTSIDRPEITLNFRPIKRGMSISCSQLYFVLHGAVHRYSETGSKLGFEFGRVMTPARTCPDGQHRPTPSRIPKTIIFVDGAKLIEHIARILMGWLTKLGYSSCLARETVRTYSALTSKFDQDVTIDDFASENSHIRIIVATTAVGMGMDIQGIDVVVQWGFTLGRCVSDLWQRFGRAARGLGRHGTAVMFLPYWMFDNVGFGSASISKPNAEKQKKAKQPKNTMAASRMQLAMQMSRAIAGLDDSVDDIDEDIVDIGLNGDNEDGGEDAATGRRGRGGQKQQDPQGRGRIPWTKNDLVLRSKVPDIWMEIVNGTCHRRPVLVVLQEQLSGSMPSEQSPRPNECCSKCTPELESKAWDEAPEYVDVSAVKRPGKKTKSGKMLAAVEQWCRVTAKKLFEDQGWVQIATPPPTTVMSFPVQVNLGKELVKLGMSYFKTPPQLEDVESFLGLESVQAWQGNLKELVECGLISSPTELMSKFLQWSETPDFRKIAFDIELPASSTSASAPATELVVNECARARQAKVISENQAQLDEANTRLATCSEGDAGKLVDEVRRLECRRSDEQSLHRLLGSKHLQAQRTRLENLGYSAIQPTTHFEASEDTIALVAPSSTPAAQLDEDPDIAVRPSTPPSMFSQDSRVTTPQRQTGKRMLDVQGSGRNGEKRKVGSVRGDHDDASGDIERTSAGSPRAVRRPLLNLAPGTSSRRRMLWLTDSRVRLEERKDE